MYDEHDTLLSDNCCCDDDNVDDNDDDDDNSCAIDDDYDVETDEDAAANASSQAQYVCLHKALLEAYCGHDTNVCMDRFDVIYSQQITAQTPHPRLDKEFQVTQSALQLHKNAEHIKSFTA